MGNFDRKNVYLFYKKTPELMPKIDQLHELGRKQGFHLVDDYRDANIIASVGGDASFLQAIRKTGFQEDALYLGINSGQLGFYTDFDIDNIQRIQESIENDMTKVFRYPVIEVNVDDQKSFFCINECSIRSNIIKTFAIDVYIDDLHFETFRGDGLVVSTPTGSTAYNKSLNGAVVDPDLGAMQLTEISSLNNNEYRTLGSPLILGDRELRLNIVQNGNDHPIISADNEALPIRNCHKVRIKLADRQVKTLKLKDNSFFHKVKKSFL
ncbi:NAD kinase [Texcoconibacillus texcoconensis]|uniref:NAD kinase n=1 Tax=Texcoconibacillus texcoconensis TaxID=1095777 RepID=A0A840QMZ9_9BACI|nr:NAD kinase [Texcoconibacillus texcoconensis]MBB5172754.1 NAD+ kinase [Texcoconibacillus texcoconensis]